MYLLIVQATLSGSALSYIHAESFTCVIYGVTQLVFLVFVEHCHLLFNQGGFFASSIIVS